MAGHLATRLIWHVSRHVADGQFAQMQLTILRRLEDAGGEMTHRDILRAMHSKRPTDLRDALQSLVDQERIKRVEIPGKTRLCQGYRRL